MSWGWVSRRQPPVRIQARQSQSERRFRLAASAAALNRSEAILAMRGDYNARPFTLLQERADNLLVAECMPQRSLLETSVEVFEFTRNQAAN